tara:strand:- start:19 stop:591 length:573 start_codon:yes stop_codon:yes gene_type:complete
MGLAQDKWHKANKDKVKEIQRKRDASEQAKAYRKKYHKEYNQREDVIATRQERSKTPEAMEYQRQYKKQDRLNQPHLYRWRGLLSSTISKLKISKDDTTERLMGYSPAILLEHLSSLDENWTEYVIDHKIPITWFKSTAPISVVNDLRNIHLLTHDDNLIKGNRHAHPVCEEYHNVVLEHIIPEYRSSLK